MKNPRLGSFAKEPIFVGVQNSITAVVRNHLSVELPHNMENLIFRLGPVRRETVVIAGHLRCVHFWKFPFTYERFVGFRAVEETEFPVWLGFEREPVGLLHRIHQGPSCFSPIYWIGDT